MDEGTANLDPVLEQKVMASLSGLNITRVMVAHREAAARGSDRVLLVDKGRVVEITGLTRSPFDGTAEAGAGS